MSLLPLIAIVGPTAVGKTALAIEVAKAVGGEIISGDSMQVYRQMDIGTAKPSMEERQGIPHHLIDIMDPDEEYSVALFQKMAEELIKDISARGKVPILAGGTGLYVRSVIDHYDFTDFAVNQDFRTSMQQEAESLGNEHLHQKLALVDPVSAEKLHPNDVKRIIRALEVYHYTGKPISSYHRIKETTDPKYNLFMIGLNMDRERLYQRINLRVEQMMEMGLVAEVQKLLDQGYSPELTSMRGLGYKEIVNYLRGDATLEEAVDELKQNTRHFAKRQLTWFRPEQRIQWKHVEGKHSLGEIAEEIIQGIAGQFI